MRWSAEINDPREAVVAERISRVKSILVFASPKGGVGKTTVSCGFALCAAKLGYRAGLLDLDVTNPTSHIVLGIDPKSVAVEEDRGVKPVEIRGLKFFSPALFANDEPTPLRGSEIHDAILEILAVVRWDELDVLVVDAPPGLSDEFLDLVRYIPRALVVMVTTPSPLSIASTKRFLKYLKDEGVSTLGLVENMGEGTLEGLARELKVEYLGYIPFDPELDDAISRGKLESTKFFSYIARICSELLPRIISK